MNPEFLHAIWLIVVPIMVYAYKDIKKKMEELAHKAGKHEKKLARHKENIAAISDTLNEVKKGIHDLSDKIDSLIARKD